MTRILTFYYGKNERRNLNYDANSYILF